MLLSFLPSFLCFFALSLPSFSWSIITLKCCISFYCTTMWISYMYIYPRRRQWHPTPVLLPGKSHGQRSLVGCSPWGRYESDTTERLHFHFSLSCIGEGNGSPLQCSCLENPRERGAWPAIVPRVAKSQTRLKWLSKCIYVYPLLLGPPCPIGCSLN